jgi:hypothetical protein
MTQSAALPALFISHGSPDTVIADTQAAAWLRRMAADLPRPRAIVVASAHFEVSGGVAVSADPDPETIHDFGGFAPELYAMQYPAPGEPELARRIADDLQGGRFSGPRGRQARFRPWCLGAAQTGLSRCRYSGGVAVGRSARGRSITSGSARRWPGLAARACW